MANPWDSDPVISSGGNPWDADEVILAPKKQTAGAKKTTSGRPDFSNVSARISSTSKKTGLPTVPGGFNRRQYEAEAALARQQAEDPLAGIGTLDRLLGSLGKTFADSGRGIKQAGTDAMLRSSAAADQVLGATGMTGARDTLRGLVGKPLYDSSQRQRAEVGERRRLEAPISSGSLAGVTGNVAGNALIAMGPGQLSKGTALARVLNPTTIRGNTLAGLIYGGAQGYQSGEEQGINMLAGAAGGAAGAGLAKGAGVLARRLAASKLSGAERAAGREIFGPEGSARKIDIQESRVPGVRRGLGDATGDTRIQSLERNQRRTDQTGAFDDMDSANNEARIAALEGIAGDDAALAAAKAARSKASEPFYAAAQSANVAIGPEMQAIVQRLPASVLSKARQLATMEGAANTAPAGSMSGKDLHYIKLALDDEIGKVGPGSMGNTERALAMQLKDDFLTEVGKQIPSYGQGMQTFAAASRPIGRMQAGREMLDRSTGQIADFKTGVRPMQPNAFSRAYNDLDGIAQSSTGFKKAKAGDVFDPGDLSLLANLQDDMGRQAARASNRSQSGSATMEATELFKKKAISSLASRYGQKLPGIGGMVEVYDAAKTNMLREKLTYLLTNTEEAKRVLSTLSAADKKLVRGALIQLAGKTGMFAPTINDEPK